MKVILIVFLFVNAVMAADQNAAPKFLIDYIGGGGQVVDGDLTIKYYGMRPAGVEELKKTVALLESRVPKQVIIAQLIKNPDFLIGLRYPDVRNAMSLMDHFFGDRAAALVIMFNPGYFRGQIGWGKAAKSTLYKDIIEAGFWAYPNECPTNFSEIATALSKREPKNGALFSSAEINEVLEFVAPKTKDVLGKVSGTLIPGHYFPYVQKEPVFPERNEEPDWLVGILGKKSLSGPNPLAHHPEMQKQFALELYHADSGRVEEALDALHDAWSLEFEVVAAILRFRDQLPKASPYRFKLSEIIAKHFGPALEKPFATHRPKGDAKAEVFSRALVYPPVAVSFHAKCWEIPRLLAK